MIGGDTCYGSNDVIVYRYEIAPDLILGPDDVIRETAELLRLEEPKTIAHETKHLENAKYGNPLFTMKNYYEISGLYALDEVSAYATAYLGTGFPHMQPHILAQVFQHLMRFVWRFRTALTIC